MKDENRFDFAVASRSSHVAVYQQAPGSDRSVEARMHTETRHPKSEMHRMKWEEICRDDELRGRWIAMDECLFDESTGRATEGLVVDADDDLAELCARIRESERTNCSILFAGDEHSSYRGSQPRISIN